MHEKLISELEYHRSMIPSYAFAMDLLDNAAAALREDAGTIAELREKYDTTVADFESKVESLNDRLIAASYDKILVETARETHLENERLFKECADLRAKLKACEEESSEYEKALDAVWVNDGKWNYETHQERDTGVNGFTIATGDIEANTYKRLVYNAESPLDAILAALKEGK